MPVYERSLNIKKLLYSRSYIQAMFGETEIFKAASFSGEEVKEIINVIKELTIALINRETIVKKASRQRIAKYSKPDALTPFIQEIVTKNPTISTNELLIELEKFKHHGINDINTEEIIIEKNSFPISGLKDRLTRIKKNRANQ
jgi:hypothetical protein